MIINRIIIPLVFLSLGYYLGLNEIGYELIHEWAEFIPQWAEFIPRHTFISSYSAS